MHDPYLVAEVTSVSQTVDAEQTLPHSATQTLRNTHPDEPLDLKNTEKVQREKVV